MFWDMFRGTGQLVWGDGAAGGGLLPRGRV